MKNQSWLSLFATVALMLMPGGASAQHDHGTTTSQGIGNTWPDEREQVLKAGKNGDIQFRTPTRFGELTLKPGQYQVQHRVDGSDHFIYFTEVTKGNLPTSDGVLRAWPGEMKSRLQHLKKNVSRTTVYSTKEFEGFYRVTIVKVAGENVAHVF